MPRFNGERLLTVDEAIEIFGLTRNEILEAIHNGALAASLKRGPTGFRIRAGDARAFAKTVHASHLVKARESTA